MPPRGKFSKPTRGGGKKFSRDVRPAEDAPGMWDDGPREPIESEEDSDSEEDSEEEDSDDDAAAGAGSSSSKPKLPVITADMSREERKAAQKALKEAKRAQLAKGVASMSLTDDEEEEQAASSSKPVPQKAGKAGIQTSNPNAGNTDPTMSRKEREAVEAAAAKERYRKLHEAGKTEEAKSDLARLALIRKEREEKAKQRQAELEEKKRQADIKALASGKKMK